MIDLDPTLPLRLAVPIDPAPGRSLTARALGGLAITLGGLAAGTLAAAIGLTSPAVALVEMWPR